MESNWKKLPCVLSCGVIVGLHVVEEGLFIAQMVVILEMVAEDVAVLGFRLLLLDFLRGGGQLS
jgi:hypothetical protein